MAHCWQSQRRQWSSWCFSLHHGLQSIMAGASILRPWVAFSFATGTFGCALSFSSLRGLASG